MSNNTLPRVSPCLLTAAFTLLQNRVAGVANQIRLDGFDIEPNMGMFERKGPQIIGKVLWMDAKSAAAYLTRINWAVKELNSLGYDTTWLQGAHDEYVDNVKA